ncbi:hypothetical protein STEG23_008857, partial [Scotinomys teguina]
MGDENLGEQEVQAGTGSEWESDSCTSVTIPYLCEYGNDSTWWLPEYQFLLQHYGET